jgi:cell division protein FtsI (penicillin-binding protein 3)
MAVRTARNAKPRLSAVRNVPARPVTISRWRLNAVLLIAVLLIGRVAVRLGELQVAESPRLSAMARSEIDRVIPIEPRRGTIRDRMGNVLALDVDRESLYVEPQRIDPKQAAKLATVLSGLLGMPAGDIQAALLSDKLWVPIKRWIEPEIAERIAVLMEDDPETWAGLHFQYEPRRVYPQGSFAAHTLGAVNLEGSGISGVEGYYDTVLRGHTGTITAEVDAAQNPIWIAPQQERPASDGADLELTLDPLVQHVIEAELKKAVDEHNADGGTVIVLEPKTGAIRGIASYPTFDPNRYNEYPAETYNINPALGAVYEPGSTFKVLTVAAGLQARAFTADTTVPDTGTVCIHDACLSNWNGGALQLNELMGPDVFYAAVKAFGFGQPTGVDIAGETAGLVRTPDQPDWVPVVLSTNSYGQGIAVSPLQQVRMMAAIGNDGTVMRPYIVQKRCRGDDCVVTQPKEVGQAAHAGELGQPLFAGGVGANHRQLRRQLACAGVRSDRQDRHLVDPRRAGRLRPERHDRLGARARPGRERALRHPGQDRPPARRYLGREHRHPGVPGDRRATLALRAHPARPEIRRAGPDPGRFGAPVRGSSKGPQPLRNPF